MRSIEKVAGGGGGICICYSIKLIKVFNERMVDLPFISVISV